MPALNTYPSSCQMVMFDSEKCIINKKFKMEQPTKNKEKMIKPILKLDDFKKNDIETKNLCVQEQKLENPTSLSELIAKNISRKKMLALTQLLETRIKNGLCKPVETDIEIKCRRDIEENKNLYGCLLNGDYIMSESHIFWGRMIVKTIFYIYEGEIGKQKMKIVDAKTKGRLEKKKYTFNIYVRDRVTAKMIAIKNSLKEMVFGINENELSMVL